MWVEVWEVGKYERRQHRPFLVAWGFVSHVENRASAEKRKREDAEAWREREKDVEQTHPRV